MELADSSACLYLIRYVENTHRTQDRDRLQPLVHYQAVIQLSPPLSTDKPLTESEDTLLIRPLSNEEPPRSLKGDIALKGGKSLKLRRDSVEYTCIEWGPLSDVVWIGGCDLLDGRVVCCWEVVGF